MPNIELKEKLDTHITEVVNVINGGNITPYQRGEYFGFFINRLVKRFLGDPEYVRESFNSRFFTEPPKKSLEHSADILSTTMQRGAPLESAEDLYYVISRVHRGIQTNDHYGMGAYLTGILEKICSTVDTVNVGNASDMTMAFRRHLVIRGVLMHVMTGEF